MKSNEMTNVAYYYDLCTITMSMSNCVVIKVGPLLGMHLLVNASGLMQRSLLPVYDIYSGSRAVSCTSVLRIKK